MVGNYKDYIQGRLDRLALKHRVKLYEFAFTQPVYGLWIFKDTDDMTVLKVLYGFCNSSIKLVVNYENIEYKMKIEYGVDRDEAEFFELVDNKLREEMSKCLGPLKIP